MAEEDKPEVKPEELLVSPLTEDYAPQAQPGMYLYQRQRPLFTNQVINLMLSDPRIQFGLSLLMGPIISMTSIKVTCENDEATKFITRQFKRFWYTSVARVLKSIPWGYSGSEVMYVEEDGLIHFDTIRDIQSPDARAVAYKGELVGMTVKGLNSHILNDNKYPDRKLFIGGPKCLWNVQRRDYNLFYGQSYLYGAFVPWWETWSEGGYRDMRRLWFYKNCFRSPTIRHPGGSSRILDGTPTGRLVPNKQLAREIVDKMRSGATLALSSMRDQHAEYLWDVEPAETYQSPGGLMEYGELLRLEEFEGMGIPAEVAESAGYGLGTGEGRSIPLIAFLSWLQLIANWLVFDFDNQCVKPLVRLGFADGVRYGIEVNKLIDVVMNDQTEPLAEDGEEGAEVDEEGNPLPGNENGGKPGKPKSGDKKPPEANGKKVPGIKPKPTPTTPRF